MSAQTCIFIGPQGSGKGTQADRLTTHLQESDTRDVYHFEAGQRFRELADRSGYTSKRVQETLTRGDLQPSFLATHFWGDAFIKNVDPHTHLIIDGSPRRILEARIMDEALEFYKRDKPVVLHVDITHEESFKRLSDRGRDDDTSSGIERRLDQYEAETQPVIEHYQNKDGFRYERIDGMQSVAEVESDIRSVIDLAA
jgi:adenylate kinase